MSRARVIVADDDVLLREGIASLLGPAGFEVVAQAGDLPELIELARAHTPDLVVSDIRMPPSQSTEGLEAARIIRDELPDTGILILSAYVEVNHAVGLLAGGHKIGYLLKSRVANVDELIDALERISGGGCVVDPKGRSLNTSTASILRKLQLRASDNDHRRVLAVIAFLNAAEST